jgi:hypothetical protein
MVMTKEAENAMTSIHIFRLPQRQRIHILSHIRKIKKVWMALDNWKYLHFQQWDSKKKKWMHVCVCEKWNNLKRFSLFMSNTKSFNSLKIWTSLKLKKWVTRTYKKTFEANQKKMYLEKERKKININWIVTSQNKSRQVCTAEYEN